jgi:hypothetical protein
MRYGQYYVFLTEENYPTLRPDSTSGVETPDYRGFILIIDILR